MCDNSRECSAAERQGFAATAGAGSAERAAMPRAAVSVRPGATSAIRPCDPDDTAAILEIVNEAAEAYRDVIPPDRFHDPYMLAEELARETAAGVRFFGYEDDGRLMGVMGIQDVGDVTLIRHAYVRTSAQRRGIGGLLLRSLHGQATRPVLVGTWADATWAVAFHERHGFARVAPAEKDRLLRTYWEIPERQIETSVVLAETDAEEGSSA